MTTITHVEQTLVLRGLPAGVEERRQVLLREQKDDDEGEDDQEGERQDASQTATDDGSRRGGLVNGVRRTRPRARRRIRWAKDVVNNEGLGRKKSKGKEEMSLSLMRLDGTGRFCHLSLRDYLSLMMSTAPCFSVSPLRLT